MKFICSTYLTFLIAIFNISFAQVEVIKKWEDDGKKHTGYFVYRDSDESHIEDLKKVIENAWTLSSIEMVSIDEYLTLESKPGDFTMLMGLSHETRVSQNGVASNFVDLYLDVRVQSDRRQEILGRIALSPNGQTIIDVCRGPQSLEQIIYNQYKNNSNFSWNLAYLSAGLSTIVNALTEGKTISIQENVKDVDLPNIKNSVLYIGDAVNIEQNRFSGKDTESDKQKSIAKVYTHPFEIVSNETINSKFISGEIDFLFMFQKFGRGKYLIVINVKENKIVYTKIERGNYNFSAKDMKVLLANSGK